MNNARIENHRTMNQLHTFLLLGGMALLLVLLGYLLNGIAGVLLAGLFGIGFLAFGGRVSPGWVLRMVRARKIQENEAPRLYAILRELVRRAGLHRVPPLYLVPERMLNAFAVGSQDQAAIGITQGLLDKLESRDIANILAHEISHIRHNDMRVMTLAGMIGQITRFLSFMGQFLLIVNLPLLLMGRATVSWLAILLLLGAPTLSGMMQLALSRTREFDADLGAAGLTGDPEGMATALRKLEYFQGRSFFGLFAPGRRMPPGGPTSTHPATEERVRRLQEISGQDLPFEPFVPSAAERAGKPDQAPQPRHGPFWPIRMG